MSAAAKGDFSNPLPTLFLRVGIRICAKGYNAITGSENECCCCSQVVGTSRGTAPKKLTLRISEFIYLGFVLLLKWGFCLICNARWDAKLLWYYFSSGM